MIRNQDGTPYKPLGSIQAFDPCNTRERDLFNQYDSEIIKINGTPIYYYELMIDANSIDEQYHEARGAIFSPVPVELFGYYDPITSQNYQNMYGIDSINSMTFELNYDATVAAIGHMPLVGSRLFTPHRAENWEIVQRGAADWKLWGQIRLILECKQFQETTTRGEGRVTQNNPLPYRIN